MIRSFLTTWRAATVAGYKDGMTLMVRRMPKKLNQAIVFAVITGVSHVPWIPVITVPWNAKFDQIMRECGELPIFTHQPERKVDVWGQPEGPRKPPKLSKVNIELLSIP